MPFVTGMSNSSLSMSSLVYISSLVYYLVYYSPLNRGDNIGGPNICPYCNKGWRTKSALEMHIRVHTGEEPFICPYCGKGHKQKGQLKVHITKHHPQVQNAFEALSLRRDSGSTG